MCLRHANLRLPGLSVLELGRDTTETDRDTARHFIMPLPLEVGGIIIRTEFFWSSEYSESNINSEICT